MALLMVVPTILINVIEEVTGLSQHKLLDVYGCGFLCMTHKAPAHLGESDLSNCILYWKLHPQQPPVLAI